MLGSREQHCSTNCSGGFPWRPAPRSSRRFDAHQGPRKLGPDDGKYVDLTSSACGSWLGPRRRAAASRSSSTRSRPKTLVAPLHKHSREDEYSFVIEGRMGALLGDDVVYAEAGDFAFKPRDQWHTFWNAGDEPCRILEMIVPGGFEHYFDELGDHPRRRVRPGGDDGGRAGLRPRVPSRRASPRSARSTGSTYPHAPQQLSRPAGARPPSGSARGGSRAGACAAPPRRGPRPSWPRSRAPARSPCRGSRGRSGAAPRARAG